MPNHVHLVLTPSTAERLGGSVGATARRYARASNLRRGRKGSLWQRRFYSVALDERHLLEAVRYILLNPVRAGLCRSPELWPWSSFRAHATGTDGLVATAPVQDRIGTVEGFVALGTTRDMAEQIRRGAGHGEAPGDERLMDSIAFSPTCLPSRCYRRKTTRKQILDTRNCRSWVSDNMPTRGRNDDMRRVRAESRIETGPLRFENDWPGVFIRGDDAIGYSAVVRRAAEKMAELEDADVSLARLIELANLLRSCMVPRTHP